RYGERYPELSGFRRSVAVSVNQALADWPSTLEAGDEIAFLPPVSGGAAAEGNDSAKDLSELGREPICVAGTVPGVKGPEDGAVVAFEGIVRNHSAGRSTLYLEYEAYEAMALAKIKEIAEAMRERFPIDRIVMVHRLGRIEIGETSVLIAVSSVHRAAA